MKCHFHPRTNATAVCSVCGIPLCKRCAIEDRGETYCDGCYASEEVAEEGDALVHAGEAAEDEDYADLELMDLLDTEDDDGVF